MQIPTARVCVDRRTMCLPDVFFTQEVLMAVFKAGKAPNVLLSESATLADQ